MNTWYSKGAPPVEKKAAGLFHTAILYPTRKSLAEIVSRLLAENYPLTGVSDHGVSQAIYLNDPDQNGVELYWDKPSGQWPVDDEGNLLMVSDPLDLDELLSELKK